MPMLVASTSDGFDQYSLGGIMVPFNNQKSSAAAALVYALVIGFVFSTPQAWAQQSARPPAGQSGAATASQSARARAATPPNRPGATGGNSIGNSRSGYNPGNSQNASGSGRNSGGSGYNPGSNDRNPGGSGYNPGSNGRNPGGSGYNPGSNGRNPGGSGYNPGGNDRNPGGSGYNPGANGRNPGGSGYNPGSNGYNPGANWNGSTGTGWNPGNYYGRPVINGWVRLGSAAAGKAPDRDIIQAYGRYRYSRIKFCVRFADVSFYRAEVQLTTGNRRDLNLRSRVANRQCTQEYYLLGGKSFDIRYVYLYFRQADNYNNWRSAQVDLYAR
ncbi:hypothetical protein [Sandarakinorhabdus sp.]|uniref:hypothetical protein n=1 Tax=Sandarakinorhabdus sp. TaxID=1916663 RepID=UPI003342DCF5